MNRWRGNMILKHLIFLAFATSFVAADDPFTPSQTKVALVPVLTLSGETWAEAKTKQTERGDEELRALFAERSFQIIERVNVDSAVKKLGIDLTDEEQQKRETLYRIGEEVNADLIAFVVITDVDQRRVAKF